jgi:uncharacterized membrane protein
MTATQTGIGIAAVLGVVWVTVGFWAMILVGFLILVGAVIGRWVEGRLDVNQLLDLVRGNRSSS